MAGRLNERARTDIQVWERRGLGRSPCRGIEVSASGILLDRGTRRGAGRLLIDLEIQLPTGRGFQAVARPIWGFGTQQALRLVHVSDVDRLELAEHVDAVFRQHEN
jgi:hypothetical protein